MKRRLWIPILLIVPALALPSLVLAQKYPTISYKDAADHMDEIVWVEGTVLRTENTSEGTWLLFHSNEKYIRVLIPAGNVGNFEGSIKHKYAGKKIQAVGKISQYGHKMILGVNEPKRIKIIEKEAT